MKHAAFALALGALLCDLLSGHPALANPAPGTAPTMVSWDLQIPTGKRRARLTFPALPCPAGQAFHVTAVDAAPMFGEYVALGKWVVSVAVRQAVGEGSPTAPSARPLQLNVFAEGVVAASGKFGTGLPFDGTVEILLPTPAPFQYRFAIHLTGQCQVPTRLGAAPTSTAQ